MGIPDCFTCLLRNCVRVKKQQLEPCMELLIGSRWGKEYNRAVCCHPVHLTYAEHIMRNARLDELQAGIKTGGRNINNLDMKRIPPKRQKTKRTKEPLDEGEGGE